MDKGRFRVVLVSVERPCILMTSCGELAPELALLNGLDYDNPSVQIGLVRQSDVALRLIAATTPWVRSVA